MYASSTHRFSSEFRETEKICWFHFLVRLFCHGMDCGSWGRTQDAEPVNLSISWPKWNNECYILFTLPKFFLAPALETLEQPVHPVTGSGGSHHGCLMVCIIAKRWQSNLPQALKAGLRYAGTLLPILNGPGPLNTGDLSMAISLLCV